MASILTVTPGKLPAPPVPPELAGAVVGAGADVAAAGAEVAAAGAAGAGAGAGVAQAATAVVATAAVPASFRKLRREIFRISDIDWSSFWVIGTLV
jgi:hypothetical protein